MAHPSKPAPNANQAALLRKVPSVDELLLRPRLATLCTEVDRTFAVATLRGVLAEVRRDIIAGVADERAVQPAEIERRTVDAVEKELAPSLRPVINASGVILHTNLGRAPLSPEVLEEFRLVATEYSNLEYDLA